jgi:AraC-like DNA-binding protein
MIYEFFSSLPLMVCVVMVVQLTLTYRRRMDKAIRWLLLWAIATLLLYGCHFIYFNHFSDLLPFSDTLYVALNLTVYPLFLLYISAITDRKPLSQQKRFLWSAFMPPVTAGIVVGGLYGAMDAGEAKAFITSYLYLGYETTLSGLALAQAWVHIVCHITFAIQVIIVIVRGFRRIRRFNKTVEQLYADTENKEIEAIPTILILFIVTSLVSTIVNVIGRQMFVDTVIIALPSVAFSALIFALSWVGMQHNFSMRDIPEEQEKETDDSEKVTAVPSANSIIIYEKLENLMNNEQIFLQNDLLLNDVAKLLGTNRTYLLQALSSCAHMTFKEYINRKRIAHAEQLIANNPLMPKTEIATRSGYNSMSSFYRNLGHYSKKQ